MSDLRREKFDEKTELCMRYLQILTACWDSFAHVPTTSPTPSVRSPPSLSFSSLHAKSKTTWYRGVLDSRFRRRRYRRRPRPLRLQDSPRSRYQDRQVDLSRGICIEPVPRCHRGPRDIGRFHHHCCWCHRWCRHARGSQRYQLVHCGQDVLGWIITLVVVGVYFHLLRPRCFHKLVLISVDQLL